jgi:hypothetical protein
MSITPNEAKRLGVAEKPRSREAEKPRSREAEKKRKNQSEVIWIYLIDTFIT